MGGSHGGGAGGLVAGPHAGENPYWIFKGPIEFPIELSGPC